MGNQPFSGALMVDGGLAAFVKQYLVEIAMNDGINMTTARILTLYVFKRVIYFLFEKGQNCVTTISAIFSFSKGNAAFWRGPNF